MKTELGKALQAAADSTTIANYGGGGVWKWECGQIVPAFPKRRLHKLDKRPIQPKRPSYFPPKDDVFLRRLRAEADKAKTRKAKTRKAKR